MRRRRGRKAILLWQIGGGDIVDHVWKAKTTSGVYVRDRARPRWTNARESERIVEPVDLVSDLNQHRPTLCRGDLRVGQTAQCGPFDRGHDDDIDRRAEEFEFGPVDVLGQIRVGERHAEEAERLGTRQGAGRMNKLERFELRFSHPGS